MRKLANSLVLLAIVGHIGLMTADAFARGAAAGGGASGAGASGGAGAGSGSGGGVFGVLSVAQSVNGEGHGHYGAPAPGPHGVGGGVNPAPAPAAACGGALQLADPAAYADPIDGVAEISRQTQQYIERCGCATQACIADALDRYADALAKATPRLPPVLRNLPRIVHQAAHRARVAPTVRAAARVLEAAVATVHKTIALMRAADPDAVKVATRGGDLVADTLKTAASALERANTL